jgi:hypothetical protein
VEERLRVLNDLRLNFRILQHLVRVQNDLVDTGRPDSAKAKNLTEIGVVSAHIVELLGSKAPFLAMLREWVRKARQDGEFDDLLAFGIDPGTLV